MDPASDLAFVEIATDHSEQRLAMIGQEGG